MKTVFVAIFLFVGGCSMSNEVTKPVQPKQSEVPYGDLLVSNPNTFDTLPKRNASENKSETPSATEKKDQLHQ